MNLKRLNLNFNFNKFNSFSFLVIFFKVLSKILNGLLWSHLGKGSKPFKKEWVNTLIKIASDWDFSACCFTLSILVNLGF
jgi:hypothetical protein